MQPIRFAIRRQNGKTFPGNVHFGSSCNITLIHGKSVFQETFYHFDGGLYFLVVVVLYIIYKLLSRIYCFKSCNRTYTFCRSAVILTADLNFAGGFGGLELTCGGLRDTLNKWWLKNDLSILCSCFCIFKLKDDLRTLFAED